MIPDDVLEIVRREQLTMVIGGTDTGKTTFVCNLANTLYGQGYTVGVIDADVGQSDIGPPTTIGFGTVEQRLKRLADVRLRQLYFVGAISPKGSMLPLVVGTRRMLDAALADGLQKILVDTTGLISGPPGRIVKSHKIAALNPDILICLQTGQECEHLIRPYAACTRPRIVRLPLSSECRKKTFAARQQYRRTQLRHYFATACEKRCALDNIGMHGTSLFSGDPLSAARLQTLAAALQVAADAAAPASKPPPPPDIVWGTALGSELQLVTSAPLARPHFRTLKHHNPQITYVRNETVADFEQILVGVLDHTNTCCALGILRWVDFAARQAVLYTPAAPRQIAAISLSNLVMQDSLAL